jgi:hypothetical protein
MFKILYSILLFFTALLLYNWLFVPTKIMSNGQSEKHGWGAVIAIFCILSIAIGSLKYLGYSRWASSVLYLAFIAGIIIFMYILSNGRWN